MPQQDNRATGFSQVPGYTEVPAVLPVEADTVLDARRRARYSLA